jgi:tRNA 2-thiouridine synthesizing protein A
VEDDLSQYLPEEVSALLDAHPGMVVVDARGLLCPLPILRLAKAVRESVAPRLFLVLATDLTAERDIPVFCQENGWICSRERVSKGTIAFRIQC